MAAVNDVSLLAAVLSDLFDDTDANLLLPPSCKQTRWYVTETAGI